LNLRAVAAVAATLNPLQNTHVTAKFSVPLFTAPSPNPYIHLRAFLPVTAQFPLTALIKERPA
jgi:hypothetical protein